VKPNPAPNSALKLSLSSSRRGFLEAVSVTVASLACSRAPDSFAEASTEPQVPRIREAGKASPRIKIYQSKWALIGLPRGGKEWSIEEKILRVKEAGFQGIETEEILDNEKQVVEQVRKHGLDLGMGSSKILQSVEEVRHGLEICKRTGAKYYIIVAGSAFMSDDEMSAFAKDSIRASVDAGVPLLFETHRHSLTECSYRVRKLIDRVPQIRFCADLSHYVVSGSLGGGSAAEWVQLWGPILDRCYSFQCRISNGEQVQVDVGDGSSKLAQKWVDLWTEILRRWLKQAQPGDMFPVTSELGPPGYSIVDLKGAEISDRWQQALVMKQLTEQAWKNARQI
jgi:sugar phosphate isomerase/epimerase